MGVETLQRGNPTGNRRRRDRCCVCGSPDDLQGMDGYKRCPYCRGDKKRTHGLTGKPGNRAIKKLIASEPIPAGAVVVPDDDEELREEPDPQPNMMPLEPLAIFLQARVQEIGIGNVVASIGVDGAWVRNMIHQRYYYRGEWRPYRYVQAATAHTYIEPFGYLVHDVYPGYGA